jgi:cyclic pyranopterin phosphate synthase
VRRINALPRPPRISITTNALRLAGLAGPLRDAGLERVNVSLDTLDRERFKALTHRDRFDDVLAGLAAARAAGLAPVKVNSVLMRGVNEDEAVPMLARALEEDWHLRFIEQMPLDAGGLWNRADMVTAEEILEKLSSAFDITPLPQRGTAPAEEFYVNGGPATVGVIATLRTVGGFTTTGGPEESPPPPQASSPRARVVARKRRWTEGRRVREDDGDECMGSRK